jgi:hypothetical protein
MKPSKRWSSILALAAAGAALLILPTCRSTRHTVARIVTPAPRPTEVFVPSAPAPPSPVPRATAEAYASPATPSPTPTIAAMRVVTAPAAPSDRSPGVLYEQLVPTATAVTPLPTPMATRAPRATRTPTAAAKQKPGTYYEDAEGRPLPTATPASR